MSAAEKDSLENNGEEFCLQDTNTEKSQKENHITRTSESRAREEHDQEKRFADVTEHYEHRDLGMGPHTGDYDN